MYSVDVSEAELLVGYTDVFSGEKPNLVKEISELNMHKSISIISELIGMRNVYLPPQKTLCGEFSLPFEMVLKKEMCGIIPSSPNELKTNPLFRKDVHIISAQMLLVLLKKIIVYGNYETVNNTDYTIDKEDYKKIIQLELIVVDEINQRHMEGFDASHFLYSTYHLNYQRNIANEFLRMYYIMEIISRDKTKFAADIQDEYVDYYEDFKENYGFSPTEYSSLLFGELKSYYNDKKGLANSSIWTSIDRTYENIPKKETVAKIINTLSLPVEGYYEWAKESENREWDFSMFFAFPFIRDMKGNYLSVSDATLGNAFFEKLFWLMRDCYPEENKTSMAFFGRLYEKYIQDISKSAVNEPYLYIDEFTYKIRRDLKKSSDAYIRNGVNLLVVEAKGFSVLLNCMIKNEDVLRNNEKLFKKPILQADTVLHEVLDKRDEFDGIENAFIISVTMDNINAVPDYYNKLQQEIENEKKCRKTNYYFNFNIEEYEMILCLAEQGHDIFALLKEYFDTRKLKPFSNFLLEKYPDTGRTVFMEEIFREAARHMKELLFCSSTG